MLVLIGTGCLSQTPSEVSLEEATDTLLLSVGAQITLQSTVLGIGGQIADWLGSDSDKRVVTIDSWVPSQQAGISWSITTTVETQASLAAREAWDQAYAKGPVGTQIPDEPEPVMEDQVQAGTVSSGALASGTSLLLPESWSQGDGGDVQQTLIWLSRAQYDELSSTRETDFSFGLFDENLAQIESTASDVQGFLESLYALLPLDDDDASTTQAEPIVEDPTRITADVDWGAYLLTLDGQKTRVRTIEASNSFGSLTVLASPENPLVLEVQLTPLAQGNLDVLTPGGFSEGFAGYEVTSITTK